MSIEMAAIDALTEDGQMSPELAIAMAKSIDLSINSANLVTMTVFNERFAQVDVRFAQIDVRFAQIDIRFAELTARLEARFSQLENSIAAAKVWAIGLYAALVIAWFGALAADHHWLVGRQDELLERIDRRFELVDQHFQQIDQHLQQLDQRLQQMDQRSQNTSTLSGNGSALSKGRGASSTHRPPP